MYFENFVSPLSFKSSLHFKQLSMIIVSKTDNQCLSFKKNVLAFKDLFDF